MMDETSVANKVFEKCSRIFHDDDDYEKQYRSYLTTRATFHSALQKIYLVKNSVSQIQKKKLHNKKADLAHSPCLVGKGAMPSRSKVHKDNC